MSRMHNPPRPGIHHPFIYTEAAMPVLRDARVASGVLDGAGNN